MICPVCGYAMTAFDKLCPRCRGIGLPPASRPAPVNQAQASQNQAHQTVATSPAVTFIPGGAAPSHKQCPKCGQLGLLNEPHCARCGRQYRTTFPPHQTTFPPQVTTVMASRPALSAKRHPWQHTAFKVGLAFVVLLFFASLHPYGGTYPPGPQTDALYQQMRGFSLNDNNPLAFLESFGNPDQSTPFQLGQVQYQMMTYHRADGEVTVAVNKALWIIETVDESGLPK